MNKLLIFTFILVILITPTICLGEWEPPSEVTHEQIVEISQEILAMLDIPIEVHEDIFRIPVLGMDWDIGGMVYQPKDPSQIPTLPDGKKIGIFLLHGGAADHRFMNNAARLLAGKFGFKVVAMTYPGRLYLLNPSRNWPGDTIKSDGSVRTPIWNKDKLITRDQYEVVEDKSMLPKYGTKILACAKEGTEFYNRLAAYPMAFEEAGKAMMQRHFPPVEYSIYIHGHSTGGPFAFMLTQRVENILGVVGMETSPFGYIYRSQGRPSGNPYGKTQGELPFSCLGVGNWRTVAVYAGPEALMQEGGKALMRLPMLMEEVYERWDKVKTYPYFRAENSVHFGGTRELARAAQATAKRLDFSSEKTQELIKYYVGYSRELSGSDVKPVPPVILGIVAASADHQYEAYRRITLPMFAGMNPPPKVRLVAFKAGTHGYTSAEPDLPMGPFPAAAKLWYDAIMNGYYRNTPVFD